MTVASVRNLDDVQVISTIGVARSSSITLQLGGQTTPPIALAAADPLTSFLWQATLNQAGQIDIGLAWGYYGSPPDGPLCTQALLEVFDSGKLVGSFAFDQTNYPVDSPDFGVAGVGVFRSMGTFTLTTTTMTVRLSGAANTGCLLAGMLRVVPHGSTDPTAVGYIDPSTNRAANSDGALEGQASSSSIGTWTQTFFYTPIASWHGVWFAPATGTQALLLPQVADIQAALQGLSNIPAGAVQVSAITVQQFSVHFTGSLAGQAVATLVCSDPAFAIIHDDTSGSAVGGQYPKVTVNGVDHPLKAVSYGAGRPFALYHLIQDAPAIQYLRCGQGLFNSGYYVVDYNVGFGGQVSYPITPGNVAYWPFQALPGVATYQVAVTWPADSAGDLMDFQIQDGTGTTLITVAGVDLSQAPNDFQEGGVGWKNLGQVTLPAQSNNLTVIAVSKGTANKHGILDTVRLARASAPQAIVIQPTDQVTFSAPAGFLTTAIGPLPQLVQVPVAPASASRLPAFVSQPKTLKLGFNIDGPTYFGTDSYFANILIQAGSGFGLTRTAAGNPTSLAFDGRYGYGTSITPLSQAPSDAEGLGRGVPNTPAGLWVVEWQGSTFNRCQLLSNSPSTTVTEQVQDRVVGPINKSSFLVEVAYANSPAVSFGFFSTKANLDGTYACDITNVAVYPPDVDPAQTSRWRPSFLEKLQGMHCVRFMDLFGTNNLNLSRFAHFPDPANFPLGYGNRGISVPVASIGPPMPDLYAENVAGTVIRVTTTVPHGLATGFGVQVSTTDGSSLGQVLGNVIDPKTNATTNVTRDPISLTNGGGGSCHVIDATTLQFGINVGYGPLARMTNIITPTNAVLTAGLAPGAGVSPSDAADLCVEVGVDAWVNVPFLADDDCVTQLAQAFAARLATGTQVHVEYGNEAWNYAFPGFFYLVWQNNLNGNPGINYIPVYMTRMSQVHKIFQSVWQQAGRDVSEVRRVCGAQYENIGGTTGQLVPYALANGITFDELAPACYYSNGPAAGSSDDLLTREQLLDLFAVNLQQSDLPGFMASHLGVFAGALAQNPTETWLGKVVLVNYEGGPDGMTTATMTANIANRNHGVHRDPDFCAIELYHLQMLENAGVKLFNIFTLYGTRDKSQWGVYEGSHMQVGTGIAAFDVANRNDFENLPAIKSETAAALRQWASLVPRKVLVSEPIFNNGLMTFGKVAF